MRIGERSSLQNKFERLKKQINDTHPLMLYLSEHEQTLRFLEPLQHLHASIVDGLTIQETDNLHNISQNLLELK